MQRSTLNRRRIGGASWGFQIFLPTISWRAVEKIMMKKHRNRGSIEIISVEFFGEQRKLRDSSKNIGSSPNTCLNLLIIIYAGRAPHNMQIRDMCSVYIGSLCHNNSVRFSNLRLQIEVIMVTAHAFTYVNITTCDGCYKITTRH
jgi:hypothetical protein